MVSGHKNCRAQTVARRRQTLPGNCRNQLPLTAARRRRKFIVNGMIVVSGNHNHKIVIPGFAFIIAAVEHISAGFGMIVIPIGAFHFPAVRPQPGNVFRPVGFNHLAVKSCRSLKTGWRLRKAFNRQMFKNRRRLRGGSSSQFSQTVASSIQ